MIKTESCDRWYYFARPLGLALLTLWHSMAHSLQQKYSFTPHNKNNKARCKKYFLLVKTTIPICVNRKLLRMKSTAKQENNWNFWKKSFSHWYVQTLAPGVCNSTNSIRFKLQPKIPVISKRGCKGSAYYKIGICKVFFTHSCTVAILEIKKWGRHYGVNDKVGGQHKCLSCMVIFHCFEDQVAIIDHIKPNIGLWISLNMNYRFIIH